MISEEVMYILKSEIRFYIMLSLKNNPKTPKELKSNKYYMSHISSNLTDLTEKGYIECLNPYKRKEKIFVLTKKGEKILENIHKITG